MKALNILLAVIAAAAAAAASGAEGSNAGVIAPTTTTPNRPPTSGPKGRKGADKTPRPTTPHALAAAGENTSNFVLHITVDPATGEPYKKFQAALTNLQQLNVVANKPFIISGKEVHMLQLSDITASEAQQIKDELSNDHAVNVFIAKSNTYSIDAVAVSPTMPTTDYTQPPGTISAFDLQDPQPRDSIAQQYTSAATAVARVYVIDTGLNLVTPEFGTRVISQIDYTGEGLGDPNGHGTHVTSTVAGMNFGVIPNVEISSIKVLGADGTGPDIQIAQGIYDAITQQQANPRSPAVIVLSIGGEPSSVIAAAVQAASAAGMVGIVAAGNNADNACDYLAGSLSTIPGVIVVGNVRPNGALDASSNYGSCVTCFANGVNKIAVVDTNLLAELTGTSMAAPAIAGMVVQIGSKDPTLSNVAIVNALLSNTVTYNSATPNAYDPYYYNAANPEQNARIVPMMAQVQLPDLTIDMQQLSTYNEGMHCAMPPQLDFPAMAIGDEVEWTVTVANFQAGAGSATAGNALALGFNSDIVTPEQDWTKLQHTAHNVFALDLTATSLSYQCPLNANPNQTYVFKLKRGKSSYGFTANNNGATGQTITQAPWSVVPSNGKAVQHFAIGPLGGATMQVSGFSGKFIAANGVVTELGGAAGTAPAPTAATTAPTQAPIATTTQPTLEPTHTTRSPTPRPILTVSPTGKPTKLTTVSPTTGETIETTFSPTGHPAKVTTFSPTGKPTAEVTFSPTGRPTKAITLHPTTGSPTTHHPTRSHPTRSATKHPTKPTTSPIKPTKTPVSSQAPTMVFSSQPNATNATAEGEPEFSTAAIAGLAAAAITAAVIAKLTADRACRPRDKAKELHDPEMGREIIVVNPLHTP